LSTITAKQSKKHSRIKSGLRALINENDWQLFRKPVISAFILFHCMLNFVYMFQTHPYQARILKFFWGYYHYLGLDQDFGVFAPMPRNVNPHLVAVVTFADGSSKLWMNPRMERLDYATRVQQERYRKFFNDNLAWPLYKMLWPDIAAHIARIYNTDPKNPPRTVTLIRFMATMLPPEQGIGLKNPPHYTRDTLKPYYVRPEDLK
jgi:hypothetical protein